jgi:hypothetical protein
MVVTFDEFVDWVKKTYQPSQVICNNSWGSSLNEVSGFEPLEKLCRKGFIMGEDGDVGCACNGPDWNLFQGVDYKTIDDLHPFDGRHYDGQGKIRGAWGPRPFGFNPAGQKIEDGSTLFLFMRVWAWKKDNIRIEIGYLTEPFTARPPKSVNPKVGDFHNFFDYPQKRGRQ